MDGRRGKADSIDAAKELSMIGEILRPACVCHCPPARLFDIAYCNELGVGQLRVNARVLAPEVPDADHPDSYHQPLTRNPFRRAGRLDPFGPPTYTWAFEFAPNKIRRQSKNDS
jgi:hypothetical protein